VRHLYSLDRIGNRGWVLSGSPFRTSRSLRADRSETRSVKGETMIRNLLWRYVFALGISTLLAAPALAQELRGRIIGVVTDNTGAVLPGVTVTATSPALIQPQATTSGDDGSYRFPALPSGLYSVTFELSGFQTLKREQIRVVLNTTLTVNAQLQLATLQETITITGQSPVVDTSTTTIGTVFTKELLTDLPNARDIWAAMAQAPGVQMTGYDVGGSHTGTQTGFATYGITGQNKTLLEGVNVTEGQPRTPDISTSGASRSCSSAGQAIWASSRGSADF